MLHVKNVTGGLFLTLHNYLISPGRGQDNILSCYETVWRATLEIVF